MPDDINELDVTDAGLKGIFGSRFHDDTESKPVTAEKKKVSTDTPDTAKAERKPAVKLCEPAKPEPNWMDKLKSCAVWAGGFGALNLLIFYWQQTGLMDGSISVPCMWVCCALGGFGVGRNLVGGKR